MPKIYLLNYEEISLDELLNSSHLSNIDKSTFNKYSLEKVKKEKVASSYLKNKYIGKYYLNENGKPLSDEKCFNISHSHGYMVLVIDEVPIGIDIEKIRPVEDKLKQYISDIDELSYIKDDESFFNIWTNKEALVKAYGSGIKEKINNIPSLPINGTRTYKDKTYLNKTIRYKDYVITVSRESDKEYQLEIILEEIK